MRTGQLNRATSLRLVAAKCIAGIIMLLYCLGAGAATAYAGTDNPVITMSSVVGFNGFYGKDHWIPVHLTIHNSGSATTGELQLSVDMATANDRSAEGLMTWPVQLPAGATATPQIAVPGPAIDGGSTLHLIVRGHEAASVHLSGTALGNVSLVAALFDHAQEAQFLTGSTNGSNGPPVLSVALSTIPDSPNLLTELTAVVAKPEVLAHLQPAQTHALQSWVKLGGLLIVAGPSSVSSEWDKLLPLNPGPSQNVSGRGLATFVGESVTPPKDFAIMANSVKQDARVWAGTPSQPLLATLKYGRGMIVQTAFVPTDPSLLSWPSNAALWTSVLGKGDVKGQSTMTGLLSNNQAMALASASNALSPLRIPSLQFWTTVFVIYGLFIGPLLFMVLRRFKREPAAWIVLPVISVVMTVSIYLFGLTQRPAGMLSEGVGVLDLVGGGQAETYGIRAFMSPSITSAVAIASQPMMMLPLTEQNVRQQGFSEVNFGNRSVTFDNVGRWGVKYVYAAGAVEHQGEINAELWAYGQGALMGSIQNNTPYTLRHLAVCWDGKLYTIGDLKPGEATSINQNTASVDVSNGTLYLSEYGSYNHDIMRGIGRPLGTVAANLVDLPMAVDQAMIVATTGDPTPSLPNIETGQRIESSQTLVLVRAMTEVTVLQSPTGVTMQ